MLEVISEPTCLDTNCCFKWTLQPAIASLEGKRHSANRAGPRGKLWLTRLEQLKLTRRWEKLHGHTRVTLVKTWIAFIVILRDVRCLMCTYICVQHFLRMKGLQHSHHNCMQPATLLQNAQCDASVGSCLNATLCCLPPCSNVRIWIRRPQQMEANQASLCAAEGLQIRGFAQQAASMASTKQSHQKRDPGSIATRWEEWKWNWYHLRCLPFYIHNEDNGCSNEPKQSVQTFGVIWLYIAMQLRMLKTLISRVSAKLSETITVRISNQCSKQA